MYDAGRALASNRCCEAAWARLLCAAASVAALLSLALGRWTLWRASAPLLLKFRELASAKAAAAPIMLAACKTLACAE